MGGVPFMASFAEGKIQAYVGPPELGAADDLEQVIVDFIVGAKTRLDIAVQEIDSRLIAQAILDARWRGPAATPSPHRRAMRMTTAQPSCAYALAALATVRSG